MDENGLFDISARALPFILSHTLFVDQRVQSLSTLYNYHEKKRTYFL